jgi:hypothetical protein
VVLDEAYDDEAMRRGIALWRTEQLKIRGFALHCQANFFNNDTPWRKNKPIYKKLRNCPPTSIYTKSASGIW